MPFHFLKKVRAFVAVELKSYNSIFLHSFIHLTPLLQALFAILVELGWARLGRRRDGDGVEVREMRA